MYLLQEIVVEEPVHHIPMDLNNYGSYQSAKNIIDVGATSDSGLIGDFSSKGPVKDGRIKPEIMAKGYWVASTWPINTYNQDIGTSMAAPAVAGGLGLLYQRYRQLNGSANAKVV